MNFPPRTHAVTATVLGTVAAFACATAVVSASNGNGGAAYGENPGQTGDASLHARPTALLGKRVRFAGTTTPRASVAIQRLQSGAWVTAATTTTDADGNYAARWKADRTGVLTMRAVPTRGGQVRAAQAADSIRLTVYRPARATWYGPGFYGNKTACGRTMSRKLIGVAHKTLPCGAKVSLLYKGRTITVPVVDRGPYGPGVSYDLTYAAARQLGFAHTDDLGAVRIRRRPR